MEMIIYILEEGNSLEHCHNCLLLEHQNGFLSSSDTSKTEGGKISN